MNGTTCTECGAFFGGRLWWLRAGCHWLLFRGDYIR